jgi:serine/threonine protein phosphatase PrpC
MLKEFKNIYDIHRWLRFLTWSGLLCMALILFWCLQLALYGVLPQHSMLLLAVLAILWVLLGECVLWLSLVLIWHHLKQWRILDRKRFKQRVGEEWQATREMFQGAQTNGLHDTLQPLPVAVEYVTNGQSGPISANPPMDLRLPQRPQQMQGKIVQTPVPSLDSVPTHWAAPFSARPGTPVAPPAPSLRTQHARVGVGWNAGIKRKYDPNEDSIAAIQGTCTHKGHTMPFDLFIVADGMGGHAAGQEASRTAIQIMTQVVLQKIALSAELTDPLLTQVLVDGVQRANLAIWKRNQEQGSDMGTTLTAALVIGTKGYVVNVGDSRTYLYRPGEGLSQLTRDHSLVARLVALGNITPDEIYTHPKRNLIERSLGDKNSVEVDSLTTDLRKGDWLLLCSDGLWEMVRNPEIERIMKSVSDPAHMSDLLVQAALKGGGADNISAVVVRVI